ncbi:MAG: hypothetical protein C0484_22160 [Rhodospirillum sp.]|nr:hypothetical protein [Rhodospirillum sp.]
MQKQLSSTDAGMGPTGTGEVAETGNLHPPTDTMNQATEGKAASPGDVASQNQGEPTDAEAAQAGAYGTSGAPDEASLDRARQFDQAGDEAACMEEIGKVKTQLGAQ